MTLRSTTNLVVPKNLQLSRKDLKAKFLYVYNKGYVGSEPVFMTKLWACSVFPTIANDPTFGKNKKRLRQWATQFSKEMPAGLLDIRKVQGTFGAPLGKDAPHFEVSVPAMKFTFGSAHGVAASIERGFLEIKDTASPDNAEADALKEKLGQASAQAGSNALAHLHFNAQTVINNFQGLDARGRIELQDCLKGVRITTSGSETVVYVDFYISVAEAQQLTTTPWLEIRPIDLYPLLLQWVAGCFGFSSDTPLASFPVSKIARTLPAVREGDARVNENNLSVGPDGTMYWLPRTLDNTSRYEDLYSQAAVKEDGGFRLMDLHAGEMNVDINEPSKQVLPKNIPVLIDWINNKFSYTTTTGLLKVQDLTRFKTADHSHIYNTLTRQGFDAKAGAAMLNMCASSGVDMQLTFTEEEADAIKDALPGAYDRLSSVKTMTEYLPLALEYHRTAEEMEAEDPIPLQDMRTGGSAFLMPLARILIKGYAAVVDNLEAVNMKYAVSTVSVNLATMALIAKYNTDFADVSMKSNAIRAAANAQEATPGWEPPSIPLLSDRIGFLPHQKKVRNLLKDSPDLAIVPVQAGGGKSVLSITDILYEIKANRSSPYLILCPPHLVAQYVKEIVFFTSGKLNAVAINSYTIKRNGFERLTKMLATAPRNTVVVADYDVLRKNQQQICYGTTSVPVYPIIEFLRQFGFGYAMLDESHCFVAGTQVDTPIGLRNIEDLVAGDEVLSALGVQKVEATHALPMNTDVIELVYGGTKVVSTTKHPFFTKRGWVLAQDLTTGDTLVTQAYAKELLNDEMRTMQDQVRAEESSNKESEILRNVLFSEVSDELKVSKGEGTHAQGDGKTVGNKAEEGARESRGLSGGKGSKCTVHEGQQSNVRSANQGQDDQDLTSDRSHVLGERWERNGAECLRTGRDGDVSEGRPSVGNQDMSASGIRISEPLQSGFGVASAEGSLGDTGGVAYDGRSRALGCEEERAPKFIRLDSVTRIQQGSYEQANGSQKVYNLQVAGHPSYSVGGVLVHNSVKNDTARTRACMALIADIPKKRLASGTMAHDSPSDLALQIAMLDPTLFGSRTEFNERYGEAIRGDRVMKWKPGAQQEIMRTIKSRIVVAGAMRKEWAALLPQAKEQFLGVHLTPAQYEVYDILFADTVKKLQELAGNNSQIAKFLGLHSAAVPDAPTGAEGEEGSPVDEEDDEDLAGLLNPYLARLEQFITAPAQDETGNQMLKGEDRISPKVLKIIERIKLHIDQKLIGKVLVFTNYTASAEEIFNLLPPDIKSQALLYVAADKVETGARFENDDKIKVMIGVEQSMNTGLNLQFVSRLIRVETVWNPGTLEQGNSRVNRPELKKSDRRDEIYYDWIVADRTIDITKISRLISKVIAIAKFENTDNPAYAEIPEVPVIKMNLEAIQTMNSWSGNLTEYSEAYREYKTVQADDYREYREKHGELKLEALAAAPTPPDAKLMLEVPYTPGLDIYNAGEMGLVRIDEYLRQDADQSGDDDKEDDDDAADDKTKMNPQQQQRLEQAQKLAGQAVHTEYGDGIIKSLAFGAKFVNVLLPSGYLARLKFSAVFLITRPSTSTKDIRNQLLKSVGAIPLTSPLDVPAEKLRIDNAAIRKNEKDAAAKAKIDEGKAAAAAANLSVELTFSVSNGFLGVTYFCDEAHPEAKNALQALGFRPTPQFTYAQVKTHVQLVKQFNMWEAEGFTLDKVAIGDNISGAFQDLFKILKLGRLSNRNVNFNFSNRNQLKNFYRQEVKPSTNEVAIKPYPLIEDGMAYIVLPLRGQAATKKATRVKAPGIKWQLSPDSLVFYALNLEATSKIIKTVLAAGIHIANIAELKTEFKKLHKVNIRNEEDGGVHL